MELNINHVTKQYKDKLAVEDVSLTLTPGVWGLLGANGAGKTTLMRIVAGIMKPTSGEILYDAVSIKDLREEYRNIFGYLPQEFGFYPEFNVTDYLAYIAALKGISKKETKMRIEELLEQLSLTDVRKKKIVKLSGGMKRRVGIAQALLNDPEILILDEPTSGLDPGERVRFRNLLSRFAKDRIVLISTHIVPDVEYIASKNAVIKDGKIIALGSTEELEKLVEGKVYSCTVHPKELEKLERQLRIVNLKNEEDGRVSLRYLSDNPKTQDSVSVAPRLEDLYLWLFPQGDVAG
ncbi:MAG: ABC transporter ATP-binding protein [Blautia sp.]|nr:ABC transporter ATP-binding protein [Lachnoclostridium sp.]MCM1211412.1 ABC transporter ATP-binding protein [Blautia sp.]